MATKKKASKGKTKIHKVMKEHKEGTLRSGSGKKVKSRKQAVAIALSEARKSERRFLRRKRSDWHTLACGMLYRRQMDFLANAVVEHGYSILFMIVFLEAIGVPVPAALGLLIAGGAAARGTLAPVTCVTLLFRPCCWAIL